MAKRNNHRTRIPEVLWRKFGNRARTLADTLLALIPPPPEFGAGCRCKGRRCLSCSGDEAMSFLVRAEDSSDYRKLLTGCFVVVSEDAPPPPSDLITRWPQLEFVRRSIELILSEQPSNLICSSYDKDSRSSAAVDELTSKKWNVLLSRVGDSLMNYLFKHTSIFLPLSQKKHYQISGYPIDLYSKVLGSRLTCTSQHHPLADRGHNGKRKRVEEDAGHKGKRKRVEDDVLTKKELHCCSEPFSSNGSTDVPEEHPHTQNEGSSKKNTLVSKKHKRKYRWQRERKCRQLTLSGMPSLMSPRENNCTMDKTLVISSSSQSDKGNIANCFCCSVFQSEPRMKGNAEIQRKNIFYKIDDSSSMLPRKHILHALRHDGFGASILFNNIFGAFGFEKKAQVLPCCHIQNGGPIDSTCLYHSLTKLLKRFLRESRNCRHTRLLEKHCPDRSMCQNREAGTGSEVATQVEPPKHCLKKQVESFIWAICRRIVPSPLLGEPSNWRNLRRNISKFIHLRRYENFSLKECIYRLKISKFLIFSNKHVGCSGLRITDTARHAILECWMFWFFEHIVSPLVQANFYVTEGDHEKQEVLYYRKSTWEKLMREDESMTNGEYRLLDYNCARNILWKAPFGFSKARLRPKNKGFRMLANLRAPSRLPLHLPSSIIHSNQMPRTKPLGRNRGPYRYFKAVNNALHGVHAVLKGLRAREPKELGSSVFDYNDVYKKLVPFLFQLKNQSTSLPNVFMVVSDVSKAFDSVKHDKLLSVMEDIVLDDEFALEKFTQVICTKKSLKIDQHLMLANGEHIVPASRRIRSRFEGQSLGGVVVKKELSMKMRKEEINSLLKEHVLRNVVKLGNKFYHQTVGIPQGSVLSSLLCSFYYGHMEMNVIYPFLKKSKLASLAEYHSNGCESSASAPGCEYILLRFIDDFLFISTSKKQASMFFSRLEIGIRDYNCYMNQEKYGLNFIMGDQEGSSKSNRQYIGKDGNSFLPWSGLLVNCSTLEIQADYTRYQQTHLSSTLTVSRQGKVGEILKTKLKSYLRPKCHPIFYDSNINSPAVVRLNIYQAFLLCAMKFICHLSSLSILPRFGTKFCANAIETSLGYMSKLIKRKMHRIKVEPCFRPKYEVKKEEVVWLGLYAYSRVLKKKQWRYKKLLGLFRSKLKAYGEVENMSSDLKYAVDDAHSSLLWDIKF